MLVGVVLMFVAAFFLSFQYPTNASCGIMFWFANNGVFFTFAYAWCLCCVLTSCDRPLFGKTWRVYKIFMRSQMTVIKITDAGLAVRIGAIWLLDLVSLLCWTWLIRPSSCRRC